MITLFLAILGSAVAGECDTVTIQNYDEQTQQDFLQNYFALSLTNSAIHAPIPDAPGHGRLAVEVAGIPPLGLARRCVYMQTKAENTNKTPLAPRLQLGFTFRPIGKLMPYGSVVYLPPVPMLGTTNVFVGGEIGAGFVFAPHWSAGLRLQAMSTKTVGDIATAYQPDQPAIDDLYLSSSFGADAQVGFNAGPVRPYATVGLTDVSTFFDVGDDGVVTYNMHPYFGPDFALGVDNMPKRAHGLRWGLELYAAPGGHSTPAGAVPNLSEQPGFGRYGHVYTARGLLGVTL